MSLLFILGRVKEGTEKGIIHSAFILLILGYVQPDGQYSVFGIAKKCSILVVRNAL